MPAIEEPQDPAGRQGDATPGARRAHAVWGLVSPGRKLALGGAVLVMGIGSVASTGIPVGLGMLVNAINPETHKGVPRADLAKSAAIFLGLIGLAYLVRETLGVLRRYLVERTCTRIDRDLCVRVVGHLMRVDLSALGHEQVGALHGRITRSVDGFVRFLRITFLDFLPAILTGTFALIAALCKQPGIALAMAGVAPLSLALTIWQLITQKGVRLGLLRCREQMDGTVVEQLAGLDYVRAANTHHREIDRVARVAEGRRATELRHHFEMSLFGSAKALNEGLFHLIVVAFAVGLCLKGGISYGDILMFSVLFLNVMAPLNEIHRFIDETHDCSLKVGDLIDLLQRPEDRAFCPVSPREPALEVGDPLFVSEQLYVDYTTADGQFRRALDGLTLTVRHGETIGVAGRSGCGKTTWLRVLMRLVHPSSGYAAIGGVPLDSVSRESIGRLVGYVGQNPFVFSGTIAENIAYGMDGVSYDQLVQAATMAHLHEEILAMPGGYQARVSERGQNLSGGQRQRLALARVFLKNPPILILDEATSALDCISERKIQQAVASARRDRTVILVAHRLSTLIDTDRILVFDAGRIVESGPYDDLVRRNGVFADLVRHANGDGPAEPEPAYSEMAGAVA
ncbi:MAG: ABC-type multidrug transport system, ATPase and permease component [Planctomycetota bacterium]|nr:ABC-type multidrug transport system, ATPase and permease component [Planctomycetota bacterium]